MYFFPFFLKFSFFFHYSMLLFSFLKMTDLSIKWSYNMRQVSIWYQQFGKSFADLYRISMWWGWWIIFLIKSYCRLPASQWMKANDHDGKLAPSGGCGSMLEGEVCGNELEIFSYSVVRELTCAKSLSCGLTGINSVEAGSTHPQGSVRTIHFASPLFPTLRLNLAFTA